MEMRVIIGSTNLTKVDAVRNSFKIAFKNKEIVVDPVNVDSLVSTQPFGSKLFEGARNRALGAKAQHQADFYVGIEGGTIKIGKRNLVTAAIYIINDLGVEGYSMSGSFLVPPAVMKLLGKMELGDAVDLFTGKRGTKHEEGAVGIFTAGLVDRTKLYEHGVLLALARFVYRDSWNKKLDKNSQKDDY